MHFILVVLRKTQPSVRSTFVLLNSPKLFSTTLDASDDDNSLRGDRISKEAGMELEGVYGKAVLRASSKSGVPGASGAFVCRYGLI